ncbi:MAG TPA: HAD-IA family hydrolase [Gemmatimonadaceae bacterium]|nr:HAD-IA family hydrolase [Gemmatimonadaceae bacterium]
MTEISHIFFDIGGVLGSNGWDRSERAQAVARFQLDADEFQWRHEEVVVEWEEGRITLDEYLDNTVFYTRRDFTRAEFSRFMLDQSQPDADAIAIARALAETSRFTMMTLNNESEELNIHRIERFQLRTSFDAFLTSCWLGVRKPLRHFYNSALGIAQCEPARALFIDDRQQNLTPAKATGMNVILFKSPAQLRGELEHLFEMQLSGV